MKNKGLAVTALLLILSISFLTTVRPDGLWWQAGTSVIVGVSIGAGLAAAYFNGRADAYRQMAKDMDTIMRKRFGNGGPR